MNLNLESFRSSTKKIHKEADEQIRVLDKCCSKGCSYCCHQAIKIVAVEELRITEYLDSISSKVKKVIQSNLIRWFKFFNSNTPDNKLLEENDIHHIEKMIVSKQIPCPFLINNICSIYPARPMVCRTHIVKSNPELCNQNRLRDPSPNAAEIKHKSLQQLYYLDKTPINYVRFLPYAVSDYFRIKIKLKPIKQLVIK